MLQLHDVSPVAYRPQVELGQLISVCPPCGENAMTRSSALSKYLAALSKTRSTGSYTEPSFYPALRDLLDAVGHALNPRVIAVMGLKSHGSGLPDGGLFDWTQLGTDDPEQIKPTHVIAKIPSRGAVEVKLPHVELSGLAKTDQVRGYAKRYQHVLITNLREFWLLAHVAHDQPLAVLDSISIASNEEKFWQLCKSGDGEQLVALESRLIDGLKRCLRLPAPVAEPEDVAWFLAGHAREALLQVEHSSPKALADIAQALTRMLGVGLTGTDGRHFFHSTLVQTLFYGVFSAWVLWVRSGKKASAFSWRDTTELLHLPMLRVLFHEMTRPTDLFTKSVQSRLDLAESVLNRVDIAQFFKRFIEDEAVEYFYEPFLEAFDPDLRKKLGVWYTPREVVTYMVERIDRSLRDDLGVKKGLADPSVVVLDPCCGTGTFLIAVLHRIAKTLRASGDDATVGPLVAKAATERVFGFEILPAPYVVAHLQVGLCLNELGVTDSKRAAIYLTNSLTGWDPPVGGEKEKKVSIRELQAERTKANRIKRQIKVLVVLGNPPYNAFAGVQPNEELESVAVYKEGLAKVWRIRKFNLDDLYVRFFRLAERKLYEHTQRGVLCYISNASYVQDPSFVVFRERMSHEFDSIDIDNLNGDSRETGKLTPEGEPDPSIFSTSRNREGIRVGTAVGHFVLKSKKPEERHSGRARVRWREFWGANKRQQLLDSSSDDTSYEVVVPHADTRWSFRPGAGSSAYQTWPKVTELCGHDPISGLAEMRRGGLMDHSQDSLRKRMRLYFEPTRTWDDVAPKLCGLEQDAGRYPAAATRDKLLAAGERFRSTSLRRYALYPLDNRWCYHTSARPLWNEPRPKLVEQATAGNRFFVTRMNSERPHEALVALICSALPDYHLLRPNTVAIPFMWSDGSPAPNATPAVLKYLKGVLGSDNTSAPIWHHALATTASPRYQTDNRNGLRSDFPRVPLPDKPALLRTSVSLGERLADLLDPDIDVDGVTAGTVSASLRAVASLRRADGKKLTGSEDELRVTARWGTIQRKDVVMPGPGRTTEAEPSPTWGTCINIWLNDAVCWSEVPKRVWEFTIGGYQVLKKWLSYRDASVLERAMGIEEAVMFTALCRRLAAVIELWPKLDASYVECAADHKAS